MKKRIFVCLTIVVLLLCMAVLGYTDSIFEVFLNGYTNNNTSDLKEEINDLSISTDDSGIKSSSVSDKPETTGIVKDEEKVGSIEYKNTQYGFCFRLPDSWKDFTIITEKWEGLPTEDQPGDKTLETGPIIKIRHPLWTSQNPRQDIPIMVFTLAQWDSMEKGEFHIGAAPINPKELGRNSKYVFALPARYNFEFLTGFEEVEKILENDSLEPLEL